MHSYPWQTTQWNHVMKLAHDQRLPHAMLFLGPEGTGKSVIAEAIVRGLLCRHPAKDGSSCGTCKSCILCESGGHPDFVNITPEEAGKAIKIDQIRELQSFVNLTSQYGGYKFAIITPADSMNIQASNCLLKTLEEPTDNTVIILVGSRANAFLPTIRSRCQIIHFPLPEPGHSLDWLKSVLPADEDPDMLLALANGAPLTALGMMEQGTVAQFEDLLGDLHALASRQADAVELAEKWKEYGLQPLFSWIYLCLAELVRMAASPGSRHLKLPWHSTRLQPLAERLDLSELYRILDATKESLRLAQRQINAQMLLEDYFILWSGLASNSYKKQITIWK